MGTIRSKDSKELSRGKEPLRQQPTTSVTMLWNIVNGLKLVRSQEVEENDPRIILYRKGAAEFFEKYKLWVKGRIKSICERRFHFYPNEVEISAIYQELYYFSIDEEHLKKDDPSSPMIIRIQKALENKIETGKPFASFFQWWILRACEAWMEQYQPDHQSLDASVVNEEGKEGSYLDANEISIQKSSELPYGDRLIHIHPSSADILEVEDMKEKIKAFSSQILFEAARIPDDSNTSNDYDIAAQLTKEFISNPSAPQREIADKFGISQQRVSYHKKVWIEKKVGPQLKKYQPGHSKSDYIGNSLEVYRWLVNFVFEQIGEKAPCEILLQNCQSKTR
jgi:hypothetical protein